MNPVVHTWFERDRALIELRDEDTGDTIIEWLNEDVWEAVEDGFLDPKNYEDSAIEYAIDHGFIKESDLKDDTLDDDLVFGKKQAD